MKHKRINMRNLIEADRNYPVDTSHIRDMDSRLLGTVLKAAGIKQEDANRRKESENEKK